MPKCGTNLARIGFEVTLRLQDLHVQEPSAELSDSCKHGIGDHAQVRTTPEQGRPQAKPVGASKGMIGHHDAGPLLGYLGQASFVDAQFDAERRQAGFEGIGEAIWMSGKLTIGSIQGADSTELEQTRAHPGRDEGGQVPGKLACLDQGRVGDSGWTLHDTTIVGALESEGSSGCGCDGSGSAAVMFRPGSSPEVPDGPEAGSQHRGADRHLQDHIDQRLQGSHVLQRHAAPRAGAQHCPDLQFQPGDGNGGCGVSDPGPKPGQQGFEGQKGDEERPHCRLKAVDREYAQKDASTDRARETLGIDGTVPQAISVSPSELECPTQSHLPRFSAQHLARFRYHGELASPMIAKVRCRQRNPLATSYR